MPIRPPARTFAITAALALLTAGCVTSRPATAPAAAATHADPTPVVPLPAHVVPQSGRFVLDGETRIGVVGGDAESLRIARDFATRLQQARGFAPTIATAPTAGGITLVLDPHAALASDEAYILDIAAGGTTLTARAPAGLFYGTVTLWQLATADGGRGASTIAAQRIEDAPRFAWRGLMLDVARHFRSVAEVEALIDQMALHKLNRLHWHLTDDQGWRLQILRYPQLTGIGGCRIPAGAAGRNADGTPHPYCGFYTQDEIRNVVRYAADRYVTIVPEIDLPGHAQAAIAAYPALGVTGRQPPVSPDWGVHTWLFNVDENTFVFLEHVLDEVMALFPSREIHLGGDEAVKDQWQQSAAVQARRRALGLADDARLQGWFMGRLGAYLAQHGRRMAGWDEILEGGAPADAVVTSWRGTQGAVDAARAGHDVVLSPSPELYFDHVQSDAGDETPGRLDVVALRDVYAFRVVPSALDAVQARHVLGAQANLWTEHLRTNERLQRAAFPRAAALAEVTWTPTDRLDWSGFLRRMGPELAREHATGFAASDSAFAVRFAPAPDGNDAATLALANQAGFGTLRYTLDGRPPGADAAAYDAPLRLALPATVTATPYDGTHALAAPRQLHLDRDTTRSRDSAALRPCKAGLTLRLEDDAPREGPRAVFTTDVFDPCSRYPQADLDGITTLVVRVGQVPFNFQLWQDQRLVVTHPAPPSGPALDVHRDDCAGPLLARLPLAPARDSEALTTLIAPLPPTSGRHDLCFVFASGAVDPLWVIDSVALRP
jgi:hexosaminidase